MGDPPDPSIFPEWGWGKRSGPRLTQQAGKAGQPGQELHGPTWEGSGLCLGSVLEIYTGGQLRGRGRSALEPPQDIPDSRAGGRLGGWGDARPTSKPVQVTGVSSPQGAAGLAPPGASVHLSSSEEQSQAGGGGGGQKCLFDHQKIRKEKGAYANGP